MLEDKIIHELKDIISKDRLEHSLRVKDYALELSKKYDVPHDKVIVAALLHDCGKGFKHGEAKKLSQEMKVEMDDIFKNQYELIHGPLGAKIAQIRFGINDMDIINAIYYHTTGRANMSTLEKIIWLSDYCEPNRKYSKIDKVRETANSNVDLAMLFALSENINFLVLNNRIIHPLTIIARNWILDNLNI